MTYKIESPFAPHSGLFELVAKTKLVNLVTFHTIGTKDPSENLYSRILNLVSIQDNMEHKQTHLEVFLHHIQGCLDQMSIIDW